MGNSVKVVSRKPDVVWVLFDYSYREFNGFHDPNFHFSEIKKETI